MDQSDAFESSEYTWALAEQRTRADDDRAAIVRAFFANVSRRLRCSVSAVMHRDTTGI